MHIRRQIEVSGIVQGVGFRPYVYRLATERHLVGTIRNTSSGVTIEVEGPRSAVDDFLSRLPLEAPPLARITGMVSVELACSGDAAPRLPESGQCGSTSEPGVPRFRILASRGEEAVRTLISPDIATCGDCLREMFDCSDRRYRYPFINCTNCGPRFTITRSIPYDRPRTSMAPFQMCAHCQAEYDDPLNRRFHAQPNACWDCGPKLELWEGSRVIPTADPLAAAIDGLRWGKIVAVKGLGGFHLACDATNPAAVALLRERKRRVGKPFAIMVADLAAARGICDITSGEAEALQSNRRPIVLLRRTCGSTISTDVAPGNHYLGVFLPYTPVHHLLLREGRFTALVMTSGNLSEEPIAIANHEARARLGGLADCLLLHNRDILLRCDDSVVRVFSANGEISRPPRPAKGFDRNGRGPAKETKKGFDAMETEPQNGGRIQQLRRSRGFVPVPVFLREEVPSVLAVGGELKNTICLTKGKHAFLSQHIGDLENLESFKFFEEAIAHLRAVLEIDPAIIAYDLHPDYFSSKWALQKSGVPLVGVQHHHAHIASCMAENHLAGQVIGFALDGTGYGPDGAIWGGEVLIAGYEQFERVAHFEYVPLPGGAAAIREPWRMAVSYLRHHFGEEFLRFNLPFLGQVGRPELERLLRMLQRRVNSPWTSSCGRLFDAVAAIAGIRQQVSYEAQAAIELEMAIRDSTRPSRRRLANSFEPEFAYPLALIPEASGMLIGTRPMYESLIRDVLNCRPVSEISRKFHNGLVGMFLQIAKNLCDRISLNRVCLSGGTFGNLYLTQHLVAALSSAGFEVFTQNEVPTGDGGLSLGQAIVAAHRGDQ
jgi:hydrogenase maturation protein HypF